MNYDLQLEDWLREAAEDITKEVLQLDAVTIDFIDVLDEGVDDNIVFGLYNIQVNGKYMVAVGAEAYIASEADGWDYGTESHFTSTHGHEKIQDVRHKIINVRSIDHAVDNITDGLIDSTKGDGNG